MIERGTRAWPLALATLLVQGCSGDPDYIVQQGHRRRLEGVGVERFDSAGRFKLAGMSAIREIDVEPLDVRSLGGDTLGHDFHLVMARCGACHEVPDPGSRPAAEWSAVLGRMRKNGGDAGLMPTARVDEALILEFLERHGG